MSFEAFYRSDLQALWALLPVPALFLLWRALAPHPRGGADPAVARFVAVYTVVFAVETLIDPLATGPFAAALGGDTAGTLLGLLFVLLGDFRVYLLILHVASAERDLGASIRLAVRYTPVVAVLGFVAARGLSAAFGELPSYALYLCHELLFVAMVRWLWVREVAPARERHGEAVFAFLRAVALYVALYYGLWASADVLILLGLDAGYALRVVPNQLYYAFWVPFVYWAFFRPGGAVSPGR